MDEDLWHVRIAPDEVKQLTLEQLDDLFRLEVIEADTLLWQPGMTEWLPLSVVAGLDDDGPETDKVSIPVSAPPPAPPRQMAQTATAWPPRVAAPASTRPGSARPAPTSLPPPPSARSAAAAASWPPPAAWSNPPPKPAAPPPGWSNPPPRPSANPYAAPANPYAATVGSVPPQSARPVVSPFASPSMPAQFASAPLSTAPMARTQRLSRRSGGGGGGWVVFLAFAAGAAVTLYRNDLVHAAARSVGHESSYFELERALGGPSFGTPRAVEQMAAAAAALTATSETAAPSSPAIPAPTATSTSGASSPSTATTTTSPTTTTASDAHASDGAHATVQADTTSAERAAAHTEPASVKSAPVKTAAARPAAVTHSAPAHASASSHASSSDDVDPVFKTPKKGKKAGKASEYDPLNPTL